MNSVTFECLSAFHAVTWPLLVPLTIRFPSRDAAILRTALPASIGVPLPGKMHRFTDGLESFLHVLGWVTLRYVPAIDSYSALCRGRDTAMFVEHDEEEDHSEHGGHDKARTFRVGDYPSSTFQPRYKTPLSDLLTELSSPFKSLYAKRPPTAEDRERINIPKSQYNQDLGD